MKTSELLIKILQRRRSVVSPWLAGGIAASNVVTALRPGSAASQAASYTNLNDPGTCDAAVQTAPTWNTNGWGFVTASSQWLTIPYKPVSGTDTIICKYSGIILPGSFRAMFGANAAGGTKKFFALDIAAYIGDGSGEYVWTLPAAGIVAFSGFDIYVGKTAKVTVTPVDYGAASTDLAIGSSNTPAGPEYPWTGYCSDLFMYKTTLSEAQVFAVMDALGGV